MDNGSDDSTSDTDRPSAHAPSASAVAREPRPLYSAVGLIALQHRTLSSRQRQATTEPLLPSLCCHDEMLINLALYPFANRLRLFC